MGWGIRGAKLINNATCVMFKDKTTHRAHTTQPEKAYTSECGTEHEDKKKAKLVCNL